MARPISLLLGRQNDAYVFLGFPHVSQISTPSEAVRLEPLRAVGKPLPFQVICWPNNGPLRPSSPEWQQKAAVIVPPDIPKTWNTLDIPLYPGCCKAVQHKRCQGRPGPELGRFHISPAEVMIVRCRPVLFPVCLPHHIKQ